MATKRELKEQIELLKVENAHLKNMDSWLDRVCALARSIHSLHSERKGATYASSGGNLSLRTMRMLLQERDLYYTVAKQALGIIEGISHCLGDDHHLMRVRPIQDLVNSLRDTLDCGPEPCGPSPLAGILSGDPGRIWKEP